MNYAKKAIKIQSFRDLDAWKYGHEVVLLIYRVTRNFPREEIFGLTSQMRRCAISITSNIAEGFSRNTFRDKLQFYSIAQGSLTELQNQTLIAKDVGYLEAREFNTLTDKLLTTHKIINGLIKKSKSINCGS